MAFTLAMIFIFFCGVGLRDEMKLGQINLVPLALIYLFFRNWQGRDLLCTRAQLGLGAPLALAIQFKLYYLIWFPYLVFRKAWRLIISTSLILFIGNYLVLALYSGLDFSLNENAAWLSTLFKSSSQLLGSVYDISLWGVAIKWGGADWAIYFWIAAVLLFVGFLWKARKKSGWLMFGFLLSVIPVLNPIAWPYWMLLGFPAIIWAGFRFLIRPKQLGYSLIFLGGAAILLYFNNTQSSDWCHVGGSLLANLVLALFCAFNLLFRFYPEPQF